MDRSLGSMVERAEELLGELEAEYKRCLQIKEVSERAQNITHEIVEKLRNILDQALRRAWQKYVMLTLSESEKKKALVYFPAGEDLHSFESTLGRGMMSQLQTTNKDLYDFLLSKQPFTSDENKWLGSLVKVASKKHIDLVPQKRIETKRISVEGKGGAVSWNPDSVKFGSGVSIIGAPVNPLTQRIEPTPGVTEKFEVWVSFILEEYSVNALGFCKEAYQKTKELLVEMEKFF